jgi:SAM-dependent methyltransferase
MKSDRFGLLAVCCVSVVLISYEISVMRTFAVGSWATFGAMVISIALLGFGLAGTILTFLQKRLEGKAGRWMAFCAVLLPLFMAVGHSLAQYVPFNPKFIATDSTQWWWIGAYFVIYALPFLCGAFFIGIAFIALSRRLHQLYFWNMLGSGVGGFFILAAMYLFPPNLLLIPQFALGVLGAALAVLGGAPANGGRRFRVLSLIAAGISAAAAVFIVLAFGAIRVSPEKPISVFKTFPQYTEVYHSYGPLGENDLFASTFFHSAPGLSENFSDSRKRGRATPDDAFLGLYVDGSGPVQFMRKLSKSEEAFLEYLPMAAPYAVRRPDDVLLIHAGGGIGAFTALHYGAAHVTAAEPNPDMIALLTAVPAVTNFNGRLFSDPRVRLVAAEPRAFTAVTSERFDLAEISLIDSVGLNDDGGYTVTENFTYTVEAMDDYFHALKKGGLLSITVWNKLSPPRNVLRLLTTVYRALLRAGAARPGNRMYVFDDIYKTATILVKNGADFTPAEIEKLDAFTRSRSFEVCYKPGIAERHVDFSAVLAACRREVLSADSGVSGKLEEEAQNPDVGLDTLLKEAAGEKTAAEVNIVPGDIYHFAMLWLVAGREQELYDRYVFDIRPATDDRPYYTAYLKPETLLPALAQISKVASEWGYILLIGTLLQALIFGALIIVIPLVGRRKALFRKRKGAGGVIVYFACLGLGYMLVEMFLIQKLSLFLANPIFSTTITLSAMLVVSGLGSLLAPRFSRNRTARIRLAALGIGASLAFYIILLSPLLDAALGLPFSLKAVIAVAVIAPAAFFMGMPFPTGLDALSGKAEGRAGLLPWAWGANGALSVVGATLARLLSVSFGYCWVLLGAIAVYLLAGLIYPANEAGKAECHSEAASRSEASSEAEESPNN